jgi:GNAT superfamily N-acetyltransferase
MSALTIRRARRDDEEAAVTLWAFLQTEHEAMDARHRPSSSASKRWRNDFRVWVESEAHCVFVAESEGVLVGLVTAHPYWPSPMYVQELEVYITELVVASEHRGRGAGARLVEAVRAWAREQGVTQIRAGVLSRNQRGRAFWQRERAEDLFTTVTLPVGRTEGTSRA